MTANSGVTGKTVPQLERSLAAAKRQAERDDRTATEQLVLLATRPGESANERRRLEA